MALAEPVAVAVHLQDMDMVGETVEQGLARRTHQQKLGHGAVYAMKARKQAIYGDQLGDCAQINKANCLFLYGILDKVGGEGGIRTHGGL